jgi:hypothetical protein
MARHVNHTERRGGLGKRNDVALAHGLGAAWNGFARRADHGQGRALGRLRVCHHEFTDPADVIAMMMCDYNGTEREPAFAQEAQYRLRIARIDDSGHAAIVKCPNIIIGKRSDRLDFKRDYRRHTTLDHVRLL